MRRAVRWRIRSAQLIADMEAQIELFDFISAAETLKK